MVKETQAPNLFELSCDDTQITYSTSSISGEPQLSYSGPKGEHSFSGDDIETLTSALGTEITVTLETIADLHALTLTLLLPDVRIEPGGEEKMETVGIYTTNATTIAGPPPVVQSYEVVALDGIAKLVAFLTNSGE
jgi:hypothetical protein